MNNKVNHKKPKTVLILGDFIHEGVQAVIDTMGYDLEKKKLYGVKPATWFDRIDYIKSMRNTNELACVIIYLPTPVLLYGCTGEFETAWDKLIGQLAKVRSIIFIFEPKLSDFQHL